MQDYINDQSKTVVIKANKITARVLAKALKAVLASMTRGKAPANTRTKYRGKQRVDQLVKQGDGISNIEITDANIKAFEPVARKYGIEYALQKDDSESPPKWLVFFKPRDADALTAAFKEFTAKTLKHSKQKKPSLLGRLKEAKELAAKMISDKVRNKDRGMEL